MARGLFELRRDAITGWGWPWWSIGRSMRVVSIGRPSSWTRRSRSAQLQPRRGRRPRGLRMLKPGRSSSRHGEGSEGSGAGRTRSRAGIVGDGGSYQTIVAPSGHHESFADTSAQIAFELLARTRDVIATAVSAEKTEYLQVVQNYGLQAGAQTDHLCFDFYDLPQIRTASARNWAAPRATSSARALPVLQARARRSGTDRRASCTRTRPALLRALLPRVRF